jgi:hypothetical protein
MHGMGRCVYSGLHLLSTDRIEDSHRAAFDELGNFICPGF